MSIRQHRVWSTFARYYMMYRPDRLYKPLSTALASRIGAVPGVPTTHALKTATTPTTIDAHLAVDGRRNRRIRRRAAPPLTTTVAIGASQLHARRLSLLFLQVECLLQPKLQRVGTVGERSIRDMFNVFFHTGDRLWVFEVRNQEIALHLHDILMTGRTS